MRIVEFCSLVYRRCRLGAIIALLVLFWSAPVSAQEQDTGIQADSSASYTFGQVMRFSLRAKSNTPIRGATLFFNTPEMDSTFAVDFEVEEKQEIGLEHELALTQVQLAPFTTIRYWWRLTTEEGSFPVAEQRLAYVDDRFQWQELSAEGTSIYWTGEDATLGQVALDVLDDTRSRLQEIIPAEVTPLRVYVYPSIADLRSALRLTGRDWVGAEAMPELGVVLVTAVNPRTAAFDLGQQIPHEVSHLMLYRATGANYEYVPRWFDEGLATYFEAVSGTGQDIVLEEALMAQRTYPLSELCREFPSGEPQIGLAYAQSASIVRYIQEEYGDHVLREMIEAYADGAGCDSGVRRVLGLSPADLESAWLAHEKPMSAIGRIWREYALWILLAGGGFVISGLLLFPLRKE